MPSLVPNLDYTIRPDPLGAFFVLIVSAVGLAMSIYSPGYVKSYFGRKSVGVMGGFYNLLLLSTTLLFLAGNAFFFLISWELMWVAIEGSTLASVLLIAFYNEKTSLEAAWKYIIIGSVGIALALFGTILTYYSAAATLGAHTATGMNWSLLTTVADKFNPHVSPGHWH